MDTFQLWEFMVTNVTTTEKGIAKLLADVIAGAIEAGQSRPGIENRPFGVGGFAEVAAHHTSLVGVKT
jgi:hypothetical protein